MFWGRRRGLGRKTAPGRVRGRYARAMSSESDRLRGQAAKQPFHVVLVEPEIPPNTGNIARLCGATCAPLHLVGKLGFSIDEHAVRRLTTGTWSTCARMWTWRAPRPQSPRRRSRQSPDPGYSAVRQHAAIWMSSFSSVMRSSSARKASGCQSNCCKHGKTEWSASRCPVRCAR